MTDARSRRLILIALLVAAAFATSLASASAADAKTKPCAEQVVDDWWGNGRVDNVYDLQCYRDAIKSLPVDVKDYSNAEEDILRALSYARKGEPDPGPVRGGTETTETPTTTGNDGDPGGGTSASDSVDTSGPSSVPIPLLILGGLALLLLAAGGAGYLNRRAQARRDGGPPTAS